MIQAIINAGIIVIIFSIALYLCYALGLSMVFRKLGEPGWHAIVPMYNFARLIHALRLPKSWFALSLTPGVGAVYSVAVAYRLGRVFHKSFAYSTFWLIPGSPFGMLQIGFSRKPMRIEVLDEPKPSIKQIQQRLSKKSKTKKIIFFAYFTISISYQY